MQITFSRSNLPISTQPRKKQATPFTHLPSQPADQVILSKAKNAAPPKFAGWGVSGKDDNQKLFEAVEADDIARINKLLNRNASIDAIDDEGNTPIHWAAMSGHPQTIQTLKNWGADIHAVNHRGYAPIHQAAAHGNVGAIKTLLDLGAKIHHNESGSSLGWTPLHLASTLNSYDGVTALVSRGANVKAKDKHGLTPLHLISCQSDKEDTTPIIEFLVLKGANVNEQTSEGLTTLHVAAEANNLAGIRVLKALGADLSKKDAKGNTALDIAKIMGNSESVKLLTDLQEQSSAAQAPSQPEKAQPTIPRPHLSPAKQDQLNRALQAAIETDSVAAIEALYQQGADTNAPGEDGLTPLQRAWERRSIDMVEILRKHGATKESLHYTSEPTPQLPFRFSRKPVGSSAGSSSASSQTRYSVIPEEDALPTRGPGSYVPSISTRSTASTDSQETIRRFSRR